MLFHGFNRVVVVNGHRRGNLPPLEIAVNELRHQTGAVFAIVDVGIVAFDRVAEIRTSPPGGVGHADETDDSHKDSRCHPGCGIVPAALAMAEREGRGGEALLRAVML